MGLSTELKSLDVPAIYHDVIPERSHSDRDDFELTRLGKKPVLKVSKAEIVRMMRRRLIVDSAISGFYQCWASVVP